MSKFVPFVVKTDNIARRIKQLNIQISKISNMNFDNFALNKFFASLKNWETTTTKNQNRKSQIIKLLSKLHLSTLRQICLAFRQIDWCYWYWNRHLWEYGKLFTTYPWNSSARQSELDGGSRCWLIHQILEAFFEDNANSTSVQFAKGKETVQLSWLELEEIFLLFLCFGPKMDVKWTL